MAMVLFQTMSTFSATVISKCPKKTFLLCNKKHDLILIVRLFYFVFTFFLHFLFKLFFGGVVLYFVLNLVYAIYKDSMKIFEKCKPYNQQKDEVIYLKSKLLKLKLKTLVNMRFQNA